MKTFVIAGQHIGARHIRIEAESRNDAIDAFGCSVQLPTFEHVHDADRNGVGFTRFVLGTGARFMIYDAADVEK